jgi:hypothetical protein
MLSIVESARTFLNGLTRPVVLGHVKVIDMDGFHLEYCADSQIISLGPSA